MECFFKKSWMEPSKRSSKF